MRYLVLIVSRRKMSVFAKIQTRNVKRHLKTSFLLLNAKNLKMSLLSKVHLPHYITIFFNICYVIHECLTCNFNVHKMYPCCFTSASYKIPKNMNWPFPSGVVFRCYYRMTAVGKKVKPLITNYKIHTVAQNKLGK